jgi:hypothetical protein
MITPALTATTERSTIEIGIEPFSIIAKVASASTLPFPVDENQTA